MVILSYLFLAMHLLGLALGLGSATVKMLLLIKCKSNYDLYPSFFKLIKPMTRLIIVGIILLTISGVGWIIMGYSFTPILITKIVLVALMWLIGPIIDNVIEPKMQHAIELSGTAVAANFRQLQNKYLLMEITATGLMYAAAVIGMFL